MYINLRGLHLKNLAVVPNNNSSNICIDIMTRVLQIQFVFSLEMITNHLFSIADVNSPTPFWNTCKSPSSRL